MEYASKAVGKAALTTGIIGTAGSALNAIANAFVARPVDPEDRPVTRYEMSLIRENIELKAAQYTDHKAEFIEGQISQQLAYNAAANVTTANIMNQIHELYGITKLMIPNSEVVPASSGS